MGALEYLFFPTRYRHSLVLLFFQFFDPFFFLISFFSRVFNTLWEIPLLLGAPQYGLWGPGYAFPCFLVTASCTAFHSGQSRTM